MNGNSSLRQQRAVYKMPLALGISTLVGLLFALVGDGIYDIASWIALAIPIGLLAFHLSRR